MSYRRKKDERDPHSPKLKDLSADWTEYLEEFALHTSWKLSRDLHRIKGASKDVQSQFVKRFPSHQRGTCIDIDTEHKVEGQDVQCRSWCFFNCYGSCVGYPKEKNAIRKTKRCLGIQPPNQYCSFSSGKLYTALTFTGSGWKILLWCCRWECYAMSWLTPTWPPGEHTERTKGKKDC